MTKLFDNTQFGDIFYTTENKRAVFLRFAENSEYNFAILYVEDWGTIQVFRGNGREVHGEVAHDIIGKKEPPLPSNPDEAAEKVRSRVKDIFDSLPKYDIDEERHNRVEFSLIALEAFAQLFYQAGAGWMAGQGESFDTEIINVGVLSLPELKIQAGDRVIVQIRKKHETD